jgi:hypothetical protein
MRRGSPTRRLKPMRRKPVVGAVLASQGPLARVRNAATALLRPIMEAAGTARIRHTMAATVEIVPIPAFKPARPKEATADTVRVLLMGGATSETVLFPAFKPARPKEATAYIARVLPTAEAMAETVPCPVFKPARPMEAAADTAPVLPTVEVPAQTAPCPAIAPARPTGAAADTSPADLLAGGERSTPAAAVFTVAGVVNDEFSQVVSRGPMHTFR